MGVDTPFKPFPRVIHKNAALFRDVESILEIGAGRGRFVDYFLKGEYHSGRWRGQPDRLYHVRAPVVFRVRRYTAVEPHKPFCQKLRERRDPRLEVVCARWEEARDALEGRRYDMVILWDVLMFLEGDPYETLEDLIHRTRRYFLFSLYPVRTGILPPGMYRRILEWLDSHRNLRLVARSGYNRIYEKVQAKR